MYVISLDGVQKIICHEYCAVLSWHICGINSKNTISDGAISILLYVTFINQRMPLIIILDELSFSQFDTPL